MNPENNWTSVYLFYERDLNILLAKLVVPLINQWTDKKLITNYFFIRYWEEGHHVRLRIKTAKLSHEDILKSIMDIYEHTFATPEYHDDNFNVVFSVYEREAERYGGEKSIILAERFFEYQSKVTLQVLTQNLHKWNYNLALSTSMQMFLIFLKVSGKTIEDCVSFLNYLLYLNIAFSVKESEYPNLENEIAKNIGLFNKSYSQQKTTIDYICKEIWSHSGWKAPDWRFQWKKYTKEIIRNFQMLNSSQVIETPSLANQIGFPKEISTTEHVEWAVWHSYFHMINNRLGLYMRDEPFVYFVLREGLKTAIKKTLQRDVIFNFPLLLDFFSLKQG